MLFAVASASFAGRLALMTNARSASGATMSGSTTTAAQSYKVLKGLLQEVSALSEIQGILGYDEQVFMPAGAAASRAAQKGALAKIIHDKSTSAEMKAAIDGVRGSEDAFDDERIRANIRDAVEHYDKDARKSSELAQKEAQLESEANQAWAKARAASDFSIFAGKRGIEPNPNLNPNPRPHPHPYPSPSPSPNPSPSPSPKP